LGSEKADSGDEKADKRNKPLSVDKELHQPMTEQIGAKKSNLL
jgi:hypothetical protein